MAVLMKLQGPRHDWGRRTLLEEKDDYDIDKLNEKIFTAGFSNERALEFDRQITFLRYLKHSYRCKNSAESGCPQKYKFCKNFRELYLHVCACSDDGCSVKNCSEAKRLMSHHASCRKPFCPVCIPVKHESCKNLPCPVCVPVRNAIQKAKLLKKRAEAARKPQEVPPTAPEILNEKGQVSSNDQQQPATKKVRLDAVTEQLLPEPGSLVSLVAEGEFPVSVGHGGIPEEPETTPFLLAADTASAAATVTAPNIVTVEFKAISEGNQESPARGRSEVSRKRRPKLRVTPPPAVAPEADVKIQAERARKGMKGKVTVTDKTADRIKKEASSSSTVARRGAPSVKTEDAGMQQVEERSDLQPQRNVTSLAELFTANMIKQHVQSLRSCAPGRLQGKGKLPAADPALLDSDDTVCNLCEARKLFFDPQPIYCTNCGKRIVRNARYYSSGLGEGKVYICGKCHTDSKGDFIIEGYNTILRSSLAKLVHNEQSEEDWVACDTCDSWAHQVCALFNKKMNEDSSVFTCPLCLSDQMERGLRRPLPATAVLGAKDLPRSQLSDELEARLRVKLEEERKARAQAEGFRDENDVPGAEELVVRVVSSVNKTLEPRDTFSCMFPKDTYPKEFPFKSRVVLLFQKIEGVEVCLFGMYVQEYGSDCAQPNCRRVYLSYLDSVKYFRPENVRTQEKEALRTFVYHEILIGYLRHCKRRGFTSCYIWACPPLKGDDYILYCHPEIQKTPQPAKLREWYLKMLGKAQAEGIVAEVSTVYDTFFVQQGAAGSASESRVPILASRLPYFEGDYWPGACEEVLAMIQAEKSSKEGERKRNRGQSVGTKGKRGGKRSSLPEDQPDVPLEEAVMQRLGSSTQSMKEDFIMVHMYPCCAHCKEFILGDRKWQCKTCDTFTLCYSCFCQEMERRPEDRHPLHSAGDVHSIVQRASQAAPGSTEDSDEAMESEFFDTRQNFLSLCQGNHYQYDSLRRAKHSSMMVLYHLHNPQVPGFVSSCNVCHHEQDPGQVWRCAVCEDFDVCGACFDAQEQVHEHPLEWQGQAGSAAQAQNIEGRKLRLEKVRKMQDVMKHCSTCPSFGCDYNGCHKMFRLFKHGRDCQVRAAQGCVTCKLMWVLMTIHSKSCKVKNCSFPRCRDLKKHLMLRVVQSENRRRSAWQEMVSEKKQRAP